MGGNSSKIELTVVRDDESFDIQPCPKATGLLSIKYPREMLRQGVTGDVFVRLVVNEDGTTCDAAVVGATNPEFTAEVLNRVRQWSFFPAKRGGVPVRCAVECKVSFEIADE